MRRITLPSQRFGSIILVAAAGISVVAATTIFAWNRRRRRRPEEDQDPPASTIHSIDETWDNSLNFCHNNITHQVFRKKPPGKNRTSAAGGAPAVLIMHEMPGMTKECIRWAEEVVAAGFTVYLPLFFNKPGKFSVFGNSIRICIRREFHFLKNNTSGPITDWLRALCDVAHDECGGRGVGAIGMCMTGGFALALIQKPTRVVAPVLSQPSMPIVVPFFQRGKNAEKRKCSFGVCEKAMADTKEFVTLQKKKDPNFRLPVYRFEEDFLCPRERLESLRDQLDVEDIVTIVPDEGDDKGRISTISKEQRKAAKIPWHQAHAVLTGYSGTCDESDPTTIARQQVLAYLRKQLIE